MALHQPSASKGADKALTQINKMKQVLLFISFLQYSDKDRKYFCGRCLSYNFPRVDESGEAPPFRGGEHG